jgi:tRNA nucleotidyltransferase (CCA-adding enzyme)
MLVGGSVRDRLLGIESQDFDIEVYNLDPTRLRTALEQIGHVNKVGEHFSVYKLVFHHSPLSQSYEDSMREQSPSDRTARQERFEIDVSIPRRESKFGRGHRGFVIEGDPEMQPEEAARRRDFTINAILYDPLTDTTIDPYRGREDLSRRVLRAVSADTFIEDSLRVLRAVQLAARFGMTIEPATAELCRNIDLSDLPSERIWGEIEKLLTLAERPSIGLDAALELGVLNKLFPEIGTLIGSHAKTDARIGEDAFNHTKHALDEAVMLAADLPKAKRVAIMLASLCHNLDDSIASDKLNSCLAARDQTNSAAGRTLSILQKLGLHSIGGYDVRSQVLALVREHRKPRELYGGIEITTDGDFRRLAQRVDLDLLYRLSTACARASAASTVAEEWFIERARLLGVEHGPPPPLLRGRHLIEAGFEPGPRMGELLRSVYELQLDGKITNQEEAIAAARRIGTNQTDSVR